MTSCCNCSTRLLGRPGVKTRVIPLIPSSPTDFFCRICIQISRSISCACLFSEYKTYYFLKYMANPKSKKKKICVCCLPATGRRSISRLPPSLTKKKRIRIPYIWTDARFPNWFRSHTKRRRTENEKKTRVGVKCHRTHFAAASVNVPTCSVREIQVPPYLYFFSFLVVVVRGDALM